MRKNLPVTRSEKLLSPGTMIVSRTDLKGRITYVNREFVEISGFSEIELIGTPHNIVRHPDMPPEAFADLWETLHEGRPWIGLVKNRCKNGDFYWVEAHASPELSDGQVIGYLSVRRSVTAEQSAAAESLYQAVREGRAGSLRIHRGAPISAWKLALKKSIAGLGLRGRFALAAMLAACGVIALGYQTWRNVDSVSNAAHVFEIEHFRPLELAARHIETLQDARAIAAAGFVPGGITPDDAARRIGADVQSMSESWSVYLKRSDSAAQEIVAERTAFAAERDALISDGFKPLAEALTAHRTEEAARIFGKMNAAWPKLDAAARALMNSELKAGATHRAEIEEVSKSTVQTLMWGVGILLLLSATGIALFASYIRRPLNEAIGAFRRVAQGDYSTRLRIDGSGELGEVLCELEAMQVRLGFELAEAKKAAEETLRVKIGLDNVATNVMIANRELNIIYMNRAMRQMFDHAAADIRKDIPGFDPAKLIGSSIDLFHKNPEHQRRMLSDMRTTHRAAVMIGGRSFQLTVTPVVSESKERIGTAVEWVDRTAEVAVEREIAQLVDAAVKGDFSARIALANKEGFFRQLAEGMNNLLGIVAGGLGDIGRVLNAIAQGDLTAGITAEYHGVFGELKRDTNATVTHLRDVVQHIQQAVEAVNLASGEIAAGNADLSSRTEAQASSLEETAASMEEISATIRQNADNALNAQSLAEESNEIATQSGRMVQDVVTTIGAIQTSSKKISEIISVIDSIAFQTNILALNAAVEAARAGEQGRGFAVVAAEVRNLAQRSAQAAREINALIGDSVRRVDDGVDLVMKTGTTINEMVGRFDRLSQLVSDIARGSREQSLGIEQVSAAVGQMENVTQQNAALVEEAAAAAESLSDQARALREATAAFQTGQQQGLITHGSR